MKRAMGFFVTPPSLLMIVGLLAACDARQWPLADYRSGQPNATAWRQQSGTEASVAGHRQIAAKPAAAPKALANGAPANAMAPKGTITASAAMPGATDDGSAEVALVGLNMQQTRDRFGPPSEEIDQSPARVWRYRNTNCSMDVALYPDVHTQVFRVLNYEVKGNDGTEQGRRKCIAGLRSGTFIR